MNREEFLQDLAEELNEHIRSNNTVNRIIQSISNQFPSKIGDDEYVAAALTLVKFVETKNSKRGPNLCDEAKEAARIVGSYHAHTLYSELHNEYIEVDKDYRQMIVLHEKYDGVDMSSLKKRLKEINLECQALVKKYPDIQEEFDNRDAVEFDG